MNKTLIAWLAGFSVGALPWGLVAMYFIQQDCMDTGKTVLIGVPFECKYDGH